MRQKNKKAAIYRTDYITDIKNLFESHGISWYASGTQPGDIFHYQSTDENNSCMLRITIASHSWIKQKERFISSRSHHLG